MREMKGKNWGCPKVKLTHVKGKCGMTRKEEDAGAIDKPNLRITRARKGDNGLY